MKVQFALWIQEHGIKPASPPITLVGQYLVYILDGLLNRILITNH